MQVNYVHKVTMRTAAWNIHWILLRTSPSEELQMLGQATSTFPPWIGDMTKPATRYCLFRPPSLLPCGMRYFDQHCLETVPTLLRSAGARGLVMKECGPNFPLAIIYYGSKQSSYKNVSSSNWAGASNSGLIYIIPIKVTFWMRNDYKKFSLKATGFILSTV
jgi:hypothetical protein